MDPSWKICPYCGESVAAEGAGPRPTAFEATGPELKPTVREDVVEAREQAEKLAEEESLRKTRMISERDQDVKSLAWLIALEGPTRASMYQLLKEKTVVGSSMDSDIQLGDQFVSNRHASFNFSGGKYFVTDLDSANGTFVNEKRVTKRSLDDGDKVRIGDTHYIFKCHIF
jgi:hypothetical protein